MCYKLRRIFCWMYKSQGKDKQKNTQVIANLSPDFFFDALLCFWKCWHCCHIWPAKRFCHLLEGHISKEFLNMCKKHIQDTVADLKRTGGYWLRWFIHIIFICKAQCCPETAAFSKPFCEPQSVLRLKSGFQSGLKSIFTFNNAVLSSRDHFTVSLTCASEAFSY